MALLQACCAWLLQSVGAGISSGGYAAPVLFCLLQSMKAHCHIRHMLIDRASALQSVGAQSEPWRPIAGSAACPTAVPGADLIVHCSVCCSLSERGISCPWELSSTPWQIPKMCLW